MWRSILSTRCYLTRHSWKTIHNKVTSSSSSSQVLNKTLYPSKLTNPNKFRHQNQIFMCYSSVTEFETEPHDPTSSSSDSDLDNPNDCHVTYVGDSPDSDSSDENDDGSDSEFKGRKVTVVGWGKAKGVLSLFVSGVDESLEEKLDGMELNVDEEFLMNVVKAYFVSREIKIRFFKWGLGKNEFVVTTSVLDAFAPVICDRPRRKNVYGFWDLVKEIGEKEKDIVNTSVLNQLISAFSNLVKGKAAFEVFEKFEELGCVRNSDTYFLTIEALCNQAFYDWATLVCQKMLDAGMLPENDKVCDIIMLLCKGRRGKEAHVVYLSARGEGKFPAQMAVNLLIGCLSKEDDTVHLAQEMLVDLSPDDRKYGINLFSRVIRGLCRKKDTVGAKKLLFEMIEKGPIPSNVVFNNVINSLSKAGDLDDAKEMLRVMESRGLKPDVDTYSVIISGYAKRGVMDEACKVLEEAKKKHQKLCPVTFHTLIRGYCNLGEFDKAVKLLIEMKDYGVDPNVDEYNKMIQSLCLKASDWKIPEKLLEEMKQKGLHLPGITGGLIREVKDLEQEAVVSENDVAKT